MVDRFVGKRLLNDFRDVAKVLSPGARRKALVVLGMMVLGMGLETLGIGLIMPAMSVLMNPGHIENIVKSSTSTEFLHELESQTLILVGLAVLVGVYLLKNCYLALQTRQQARFSFGVQEETSAYLFESYMRRPYVFHLKANTSELLRNAVGEVNSFAGYVLQPGLVLLTETLVVVAIAGLLLWAEPVGTLVLLCGMSGAAWAFHRLTRNAVSDWGRERQEREGFKLKHLQEGFGGVKEVRLLGREAEFVERFSEHNRLGALAGQKQYVMQQMPRLGLEVLAVMGLAVLALVLTGDGAKGEEALPKLGMMAVALVRLMPSVSRIVRSQQSIRYGWPCVKLLGQECRDWSAGSQKLPKIEPLSFERDFVMKDVSYRYQGVEGDALLEVSFRVSVGESVGIVGESGSGKSTLVNVLLGLLEPRHGGVFLDGIELRSPAAVREWQGKIGYVPQEIFLTDDSLRNNVAFGVPLEEIDDDAVWKALRAAQLHEFVRDLPDGLDTIMGERGARLSSGQRQRVGIARALFLDPPVVVLDEATSSLDTGTEAEFMRTVRLLKGKKTFVVVAHRLSTVEHCDVLYRLEGGRIVASGSFPEVVGGEAVLPTGDAKVD